MEDWGWAFPLCATLLKDMVVRFAPRVPGRGTVRLSSSIFRFHIKLFEMTPGVRPQPEETNDDFFRQGLKLAKKGLWNEALAAYRQSLRTHPNNPQTYLNIGFVYYELGYDQQAQEVFERATKLQARTCRP